MTTTMCISELNDAAYTLAPSGFAPPLLASTRTSLLACSLDFGQVGLGLNSCPHPLGNNSAFHALTLNPNASDLARRDLIHTLGVRRHTTPCGGRSKKARVEIKV